MKKFSAYIFALSFIIGPVMFGIWSYRGAKSLGADVPLAVSAGVIIFTVFLVFSIWGYEWTLKEYHEDQLKRNKSFNPEAEVIHKHFKNF